VTIDFFFISFPQSGFKVRRDKGAELQWEERFRSVLVEGAGDVMATMAGYIDLNPVRAGLVEDPGEYRWSGYGAAMGGGKAARLGIELAMRAASGREMSVEEALKEYRVWVYGQGEETEGLTEEGRPIRKGFTREEVMKVVEEKGRLPLRDYLRLRVRYFADGAVLGTRNFVKEVFVSLRERFGPRRKDGARRLKGVKADLYSLRALRVNPLR